MRSARFDTFGKREGRSARGGAQKRGGRLTRGGVQKQAILPARGDAQKRGGRLTRGGASKQGGRLTRGGRSVRSGVPAGSTLVARGAILLIRLYQLLAAPWGGRCIYTPSCSEYGAQAIAAFGAVRGCVAVLLRIVRCVPRFYVGGSDPVPERFCLGALLRNLRPTAGRRRERRGAQGARDDER